MSAMRTGRDRLAVIVVASALCASVALAAGAETSLSRGPRRAGTSALRADAVSPRDETARAQLRHRARGAARDRAELERTLREVQRRTLDAGSEDAGAGEWRMLEAELVARLHRLESPAQRGVISTSGMLRSPLPLPAPGDPGSVSGQVTDRATANPIEGVGVSVYDSQGNGVGWASSDGSGYYEISGLPEGTYYARTFNSLGYINLLWDGYVCSSWCDVTGGTPIVLAAVGATGVDFELTVGGRISGRVTDEAGSSGLAGVEVSIVDSQGRTASYGNSDESGGYIVNDALPAGSYYAYTRNSSGYIDERYANSPCLGWCTPTSGTPILVALGETTSEIDFKLELGGRISGTVTDTASPTANPLSGVRIEFYDSQGRYLSYAYTDVAGQYTSYAGLPAGSHFARTWNSSGGINELYDDVPCASCTVSSGTPIPVALGETTSGIDFALAPGGRISGTVTDTAIPPNPLPSVSIDVYDSLGNSRQQRVYGRLGPVHERGRSARRHLLRPHERLVRRPSRRAVRRHPVRERLRGDDRDTDSGHARRDDERDRLRAGAGRSDQRHGDGHGEPDRGPAVERQSLLYDAGGRYVVSATRDGCRRPLPTSLGSAIRHLLRPHLTTRQGHIDELYDDIPCANCSVTSGTPIAVTLGETTRGSTSRWRWAVGSRGTVTDTASADTEPPAGRRSRCLRRRRQECGVRLHGQRRAIHEQQPAFRPAPTTSRTYNSSGYLNELYDDILCLNCTVTSGSPITLTAG